jgi:NDP-sugar pyrophosphorylase family protein
MDFSPTVFFDVRDFEHAALFEGVEAVWQALGERLKAYLAKHARAEVRGTVMSGAWIDPVEPVFIGEGTVVEPGAMIKGPTIIGRDTQVRQGAYVRGTVLVGDHCVVGHTTELKGAVMLNGAQAGHFAYIGDTIAGSHVNFGAGTKCANLKVLPGTVMVKALDGIVDTGLRKFGAIIGDHTELGCNSVTSPGTILGKRCVIYPCTNVGGVIPANTIVKNRQTVEQVMRKDK